LNIYEIDKAILDLVDPETGEVSDMEAFDSLSMDREAKIKNTALYIKNLSATVKGISDEIKALTERKRVAQNKADRLMQLLEYALAGEPFATPEVEIRYRKSKALEVSDEAAAIDWLKEYGYQDCLKVPPVTVSKNDVTALLKEGFEIPGVSLVERTNMGVK
jgi:outer membrane murein-binding lipoprotein Lpp